MRTTTDCEMSYTETVDWKSTNEVLHLTQIHIFF